MIATPSVVADPKTAGGLGGRIRRLAHLRVQVADALLPLVVFVPLCVRQADIGIQFQCFDLLAEQVKKLVFDGVSHATFFPRDLFTRLREKRAQSLMSKRKRKVGLYLVRRLLYEAPGIRMPSTTAGLDAGRSTH